MDFKGVQNGCDQDVHAQFLGPFCNIRVNDDPELGPLGSLNQEMAVFLEKLQKSVRQLFDFDFT